MKITRLAAMLGAAALLATTAACGGAGAGSPEDAAETALKAVIDEDAKAGCAISLEDGKVRTDDQVDDCVDEFEKQKKESEAELKKADKEIREASEKMQKEQIERIEKVLDKGPKNVGKEKDGQAVVTYEFEGQELPVTTKKVDGNWYVDDLG